MPKLGYLLPTRERVMENHHETGSLLALAGRQRTGRTVAHLGATSANGNQIKAFEEVFAAFE